MELLISTLEQGMIYGIMALGVYITYKILDFPDLTVDGSFPLGAAVTAVMVTKGIPAGFALPVSFLAGALAGALTGFIHVKLKVKDLLSGIIMMTVLYTDVYKRQRPDCEKLQNSASITEDECRILFLNVSWILLNVFD